MLLKKTKNNDIIIIIFFLILSIIPFFFFPIKGKAFVVILTFLLNAILFILGIYNTQRKYPFSIEMMIWLFLYFFMYFAPVIQFLVNQYPWEGNISNNECIIANISIFLFTLVFISGKVAFSKIIATRKSKKLIYSLTNEISFNILTKYITTIVSMGLAIYSLSKTGLSGIIVSRDDASAVFYNGSNSAIFLIIDSIISGFLAYTTAESAQDFSNGKKGKIRFFIQILCLLICFFPTSIPRYKMACIYLTILLTLIPFLKKNNRFFWLFVCSLFFVFPIMSNFRHSINMVSFEKFNLREFFLSYTKGDYDAYRMIVSAIRYVKINGCVFGMQLLGAFLFFIPSSAWHGKPGGSGAFLIQNEFNYNVFSNVSCPFIAEGLLNFGLFGIILFALLLAGICTRLDSNYWRNIENKSKFSIYVFIVFMFFFIMRGDLMSSVAFTVGFIFIGIILKLFCVKTNS